MVEVVCGVTKLLQSAAKGTFDFADRLDEGCYSVHHRPVSVLADQPIAIGCSILAASKVDMAELVYRLHLDICAACCSEENMPDFGGIYTDTDSIVGYVEATLEQFHETLRVDLANPDGMLDLSAFPNAYLASFLDEPQLDVVRRRKGALRHAKFECVTEPDPAGGVRATHLGRAMAVASKTYMTTTIGGDIDRKGKGVPAHSLPQPHQYELARSASTVPKVEVWRIGSGKDMRKEVVSQRKQGLPVMDYKCRLSQDRSHVTFYGQRRGTAEDDWTMGPLVDDYELRRPRVRLPQTVASAEACKDLERLPGEDADVDQPLCELPDGDLVGDIYNTDGEVNHDTESEGANAPFCLALIYYAPGSDGAPLFDLKGLLLDGLVEDRRFVDIAAHQAVQDAAEDELGDAYVAPVLGRRARLASLAFGDVEACAAEGDEGDDEEEGDSGGDEPLLSRAFAKRLRH